MQWLPITRKPAQSIRQATEPLESHDLPGPTGESNRLRLIPRAPLLCLGPGTKTAAAQADAVRALGGRAVPAADLPAAALQTLGGFSAALWWGDAETGRAHARALAARPGPILPLIGTLPDRAHVAHERVICIDTTASGGNAALLSQADDA